MNVPFIDLKPCHQALRKEIDGVLAEIMDKCNFVLGDYVAKLERDCAIYCGVPHAVAVASGTDALKIALKSLGVGPGCEVVTSPFTFVATAESVISLGATPVFVDIQPTSYNIDPEEVKRFLHDDCTKDEESGQPINKATGNRVVGLLPVHIYGQCADMEPLKALAKEFNLFILEDAAQAFGAEYTTWEGQRKAGAMGTASAMSFYPSKNLGGAGDGGMIVATDAGVSQKSRVFRVHGASRQYEFSEHGFNSRLDTMQAAILCVKLPHIDEWIALRREKANNYHKLFEEIGRQRGFEVVFSNEMKGADMPAAPCVVLPGEMENCMHTYNSYNIRVGDRNGLIEFLKAAGIGANIYYPRALHLQEVYTYLNYIEGDLPIVESICGSILALPMFPEITEEQQKYVVENVAEFLSKNGKA